VLILCASRNKNCYENDARHKYGQNVAQKLTAEYCQICSLLYVAFIDGNKHRYIHVSAVYDHHQAEYRTISSKRNTVQYTSNKNITDEITSYVGAELCKIM
jgi:hypothetical protein